MPEAFIDELNFTSWNTVACMPEFLPPCPYWINGDSVIIELDKAHLFYRILDTPNFSQRANRKLQILRGQAIRAGDQLPVNTE